MKTIIKKICFKLGIPKYRIRFIYLYINQFINKYVLFNDKLREIKLKKDFKKCHKYNIDFKTLPETFNQKIFYRRLYPDNKLYTKYADKYLVREYIKEIIGEEYLIPLYLVTEKLTQKQWDELPDSFVVKTTHDSGNVEIVKNKSKLNKHDVNKIIKKMNLGLKINFGWATLEKHYINIKPKIIVEKLLLDENKSIPKDYKIHCFNNAGNKKYFIQIDDDRFIEHKRSIYDENLNKIDMKLNLKYKDVEKKVEIKNLLKLKQLAEEISRSLKYVRIDFYEIGKKIYFGEMTFTHDAGYAKIEPYDWDRKWGEYWK